MMATAQIHDFPAPDENVARSFLASTVRNGIHVVIIAPEGQPLPYGQWFGGDAPSAAAWAAAENRKGYNAYWTVNLTRPRLNKKPTKTDMVVARFLHVDLDPPKDGTPFDRMGLLSRLGDMRVPPTFINDSGNGLQAFWRLEETGENLPAVEALNKRISLHLGGDHCHNIDRLMRLPGSVNWPNALKRRLGRVPSMAAVIEPDEGEVVAAEALHATLPPLPAEEETGRERVALAGVEPVSIETLGLNTVDPLRTLIEARDPAGRSERALKVAGLMVRRGLPDASIAGVLLNPELGVSAHCLDQPNPVRAAERAIGRARGDVLAAETRKPRPAGGGAGGAPLGDSGAPSPPRTDPGEAEVSEDLIALAFTEENRNRLRYDHDLGRWFSWDGARWQREETNLAFDYARRMARLLGDAKRTVCKASVAAGVERFAQADRAHAVRNDVWDVDPFLLGTPSGTIDLRTGTLSDGASIHMRGSREQCWYASFPPSRAAPTRMKD